MHTVLVRAVSQIASLESISLACFGGKHYVQSPTHPAGEHDRL